MIQQLLLGLNSTLVSIKAANKQFSSPGFSRAAEGVDVRECEGDAATDVCGHFADDSSQGWVRVMIQQLLLGLNSTLVSIKAANKQFSSPEDTSRI
jgi:hypothetical protein